MCEKSTKELMDEFFMEMDKEREMKTRSQIDRPELYLYEKKIGKSLVEMDGLEVAQLIMFCAGHNKEGKKYKSSLRTYDFSLALYRSFFDWYIDHYKVIKNPCNDKRIRGRKAMELFNDNSDTFTKNEMESIIEEIRKSDVEGYMDYEEAIIRLFYEGFPESIDIVNMKESDIDHENKTVVVRGNVIQLSDRLYELLHKINHSDSLPAHRGSYVLLSYKGSYFKFPTRESNIKVFESKEPEYWAGHISRLFHNRIRKGHNVNINARTLYLCGVYDKMVDMCGREEANRLICSIRNKNDTQKLMTLAKQCGVVEQNSTTLKKILTPFVH